ncbi:MAG: hypothetical protein GTN67_11180 [Hydrotalea flava]|uniref:hypothetical protein n=1 Tax=Hydrotalea lipotrueae TaxID=2803817 RepID=UPI0016978D9C|nr:hypothetical protein [Hydrotalea lipotrueae]MBY0349239.1 hypothetical protein [Hydrotalea flava]NIM35919.1 hypothetical protein [Hydrotalea flava]NIM38752.1 hypothetical protein [Hydrotalea flava]NIN03940.1 hypothetical protein [Hydrotalea flava]NIN15661.1 hypothetical protein [Hydrotalea flava]
MKKLLAVLAVAGVMAACNNAKSDEAKTDSTTAVKVDTATAKVDTATAKVDTTAAKVDSAAKK